MTRQEYTTNTTILGIDVATSRKVAGKIDDLGRPAVIPAADGQSFTPACIYVGPGLKEVLFGSTAQQMLSVEPERVVQLWKPDLGTGKVYFKEAGVDITPEWCTTQMLRHITESIRQRIGDPQAATLVAVTVPAHYDEAKRQIMAQCVKDAGLELLGIIHEPNAAALAFGVVENKGDVRAIICDFGAWTMDVCVVKFENKKAVVLGGLGEPAGGIHIDQILMESVVVPEFKKKGVELTKEKYPAAWYDALNAVITAKHQLSDREEVKLPASVDGKGIKVPITRAKFAKLIAPVIKKCEEITLKAIEAAKVKKDDIQLVILVGGSSRVPAYQERMRALFAGKKILCGTPSPDTAIAEGAAIQALIEASSRGAKVVSSQTDEAIPLPPRDVMGNCVIIPMGIITNNKSNKEKKFSPILEANTPIPCQESQEFSSVSGDQTKFHIKVVQGLPDQPLDEYLVLADKVLELPPRDPSVPSVRVTFAYDSNQMAKVTVTDLITNKAYDITINFADKAKSGPA